LFAATSSVARKSETKWN